MKPRRIPMPTIRREMKTMASRVHSAPPPAGCAGVAAFGRTVRLPCGARPSAARVLGCG
uniref:Uncharacterized protein n=1 Tax=Oryza sativa subsp. japonica TaxID=39947 RepID=Q6YVV1_ORYSJ|nr:hypothetical protein [Oryza sativa Japonica Group]